MISTEALLEPAPGLGQRVDSFEYELLDRDFSRIGELHPATETAVALTASTERATMREISGLEFVGSEQTDVNIFTDRLRPVMVLQNGARFPLGIYVFGEYQRQPWAPRLKDQGHLLDQKVERSISVAAGQEIVPIFRGLANEIGIDRMTIEVSARAVAEPDAWPAGTTRWTIMSKLATLTGCLAPHFDNDGVLRLRPAPNPIDLEPDHIYGPGRIVAGSVLETNDSYQTPNRYMAIGASSTTPIVGVYDVPASAPHSIANRGYIVADTFDAPGVADIETANAAARVRYLSDSRSWQTLSFESLVDPRHDLFDVIRYNNDVETSGLYLEVAFTQGLAFNGVHTHDCVRIWEG
jgi:hypothetical protein